VRVRSITRAGNVELANRRERASYELCKADAGRRSQKIRVSTDSSDLPNATLRTQSNLHAVRRDVAQGPLGL